MQRLRGFAGLLLCVHPPNPPNAAAARIVWNDLRRGGPKRASIRLRGSSALQTKRRPSPTLPNHGRARRRRRERAREKPSPQECCDGTIDAQRVRFTRLPGAAYGSGSALSGAALRGESRAGWAWARRPCSRVASSACITSTRLSFDQCRSHHSPKAQPSPPIAGPPSTARKDAVLEMKPVSVLLVGTRKQHAFRSHLRQ